MADIVSASSDEVRGRAAEDFLEESGRRAFRDRLFPPPPASFHPQRLTCQLRPMGGTNRWVTIAAGVLDGEPAARLGYVATVTDITEQRKLQEQLMVADRLASVGMVAARLAHEINNPLASVVANLHMAAEDLARFAARHELPAPEAIGLALRDALDGAERVRSIVGDLRVFSRAHDVKPGPIDVNRVIEAMLRMAWSDLAGAPSSAASRPSCSRRSRSTPR